MKANSSSKPLVASDSCQSILKNTQAEQMTWDDFLKAGVSVAEWARQHGFNRYLVYMVLRGERKCLRGESFRIAEALGMK